ncbi:MAG: hypothetical protein IJA10_11410 [Lachnospiraceae bacterium]|nr:hypothetical protein [Lachnospiraceae bacterium]
MKKKVLVAILATTIIVGGLTACGNKDMFDTNYTYDRAIIALPNGEVIEVEIDKWTDYEDGDQLQIIAKDGTVYLTSTLNCILINDK